MAPQESFYTPQTSYKPNLETRVTGYGDPSTYRNYGGQNVGADVARRFAGQAWGTPFEYETIKQTAEAQSGASPYEAMKPQLAAGAMDIWGLPTQARQMYMSDPRMQQAYGQYQKDLGMMGTATGRFSSAAGDYNKYARDFLSNDIGALRNQAYGKGPSYAEMYGAAQRQQAMGDIAKQAAMSSRGGTDLASRRAAIMQAGNVGANMASQIAAARVAERQQAMQQYLQAREAQRSARQSGAGMMGDVAQAYGNLAGARGQAYGQEQNAWGGAMGIGQNAYGQQQTAGQAYWG